MKTKKKDKSYMAILDRPIEELKKPMRKSVNFKATITQILRNDNKKNV